MYGDGPPTVVVIADGLMRHPVDARRIARCMQDDLMRRPTWFVVTDATRLRPHLDRAGLALPMLDMERGPRAVHAAGALVQGDTMVAFDLAQAIDVAQVVLWAGGAERKVGPEQPVQARADDAGIRVKVEAPLERR